MSSNNNNNNSSSNNNTNYYRILSVSSSASSSSSSLRSWYPRIRRRQRKIGIVNTTTTATTTNDDTGTGGAMTNNTAASSCSYNRTNTTTDTTNENNNVLVIKQQQQQKKNPYRYLALLQVEQYTNDKDITDYEAIQIAEALQNNTSVQRITVSWNRQISITGCIAFCNLLRFNTNIISFEMTHVLFTSDKVQIFAALLNANTSALQSLNLSWNRLVGADIGIRGLFELLRSLFYNTTITHCYISHIINLEQYTTPIIADDTRSSSSSRFGHVPHTMTIGKQVGSLLQKNTILQYLDLGTNGLGDDFVIAMSSSLPYNKVLRELIIDNNWITDIGITTLSHALKYNTALQKLNISKNYITDHGIITLFEAFEYNTALTTLIVLNRIIASSNDTAAEVHENSTTTTTSSSLQHVTFQRIIQSLQYNDTITTFMHTNDHNHLMDWNIPTNHDNNDDNNVDNNVVIVDGVPISSVTLQLRRQIQTVLEQNYLQTRTAPYKGTRNRSDIYQWLFQSDRW